MILKGYKMGREKSQFLWGQNPIFRLKIPIFSFKITFLGGKSVRLIPPLLIFFGTF